MSNHTNSGGWVSVLDRLPDKDCLYAVYLSNTYFGRVSKDGGVGFLYYDEWSTARGRCGWNHTVVYGIPRYIESIITHWKPIQPPSDASKTPISEEERDKIIEVLKRAKGGTA